MSRRGGAKGSAVGAMAALCLLSAGAPARADTLAFQAPAACGTSTQFVASVRQRTPLARFEAGSDGRAFRIRVGSTSAGEPVRGVLAVTEADGTTSSREVDGASCEEVVDALSLVVALTIDPNAQIAPVDATAGDGAGDATPAPARVPPPPLPRTSSSPSRPLLSSTAASSSARWAPRLSLDGVMGLGAAPRPALGFGLDVGLTHETPGKAPLAAGQLGFHARATLERTVFSAPPPSAGMLRALAVVSVCPLAVRVGPVRSEACAGLAAGFARFEGQGVAHPSAKTRFASHGEVALLATVPLGRAPFLALRGSFEVSFTRDDLVFVRPDILVHGASVVTGSVAVGFGLRL